MQLVDALSSSDDATRTAAGTRIYNIGVTPALRIAGKWLQHPELAALLGAPNLHATVGLAVPPETFASIRAVANHPELAEVPPEQDALEFEVHFAKSIALDILTTKDPAGPGAIARYLTKFAQGIQQVEFLCKNVDRATQILKANFAISAVYPATRPGANHTRVNFFLLRSDDSSNEKILIELYEQPMFSNITDPSAA
jgi:hypothetical protein